LTGVTHLGVGTLTGLTGLTGVTHQVCCENWCRLDVKVDIGIVPYVLQEGRARGRGTTVAVTLVLGEGTRRWRVPRGQWCDGPYSERPSCVRRCGQSACDQYPCCDSPIMSAKMVIRPVREDYAAEFFYGE